MTKFILLLSGILFCVLQGLTQVIPVNETFTNDTSFKPFSSNFPVYSVKLNCEVQLLSDSSLVRVVLIDTGSNHYLLFESYPLIASSQSYQAGGVCDETCFMNGIVPDSLRIDLINAIVTIDTLIIDTGYIANATSLQAQAKWINDSMKIVMMNQQIDKAKMYWRAGRNFVLGASFTEKEQLFGRKFNSAGFEYYIGGVFEFLHKRAKNPLNTQSTIAPDFDWRNRHDALNVGSKYYNPSNYGWIAPADNQGGCAACWIFAPTHSFADFINIYCNSFYNYDLSEKEMLSCANTCGNCTSGGFAGCVLNYIVSNGIHRGNDCQPFTTTPVVCDSVCNSSEKYKFGSHAVDPVSNADELKQLIITKGPLVSGLKYPIFPLGGHYMELIGYKLIRVGDTVYSGSGTTSIVIDSATAILGATSWIFKNSDLNVIPEFFVYYGSLNDFYTPDVISGPITRISVNQTLLQPNCKDEDKDGYYWWGTSSDPQLCDCPPGVEASQEDCNDNNPLAGPYILDPNNPDSLALYECRPNKCSTRSTTYDIYGDTLWTEDHHLDQSIVVHPGGRLMVKGQVFFSPGAKIIVKSQGILYLQGDYPDHPARLSSGCGQMWGGIEIQGDPLADQDSMPGQYSATHQGTVIIENGVIENARCGVKTFNTNALQENPNGGPEPVGYPSGGVIKADSAIFRNNQIAIHIYPYRNGTTTNRSIFKTCSFITNDSLLNNMDPECFMKIEEVNRMEILGCSFKNKHYLTSSTPAYLYRGTGVFCYNADLYMNEYVYQNDTIKSTFEDLRRGIYSLQSGMGQSNISIQNSRFLSNQFGAYFSGYSEVTPLEIKHNQFIFSERFGGDTLYGLYLDRCSGYKVFLNVFDTSAIYQPDVFGIIINNSGAKTNYIYNNRFIRVNNALQSQNVNSGIYLPDNGYPYPWGIPTGLRFVCNDFILCTKDMVITHDTMADHLGITYYQRNSENASGTQKPAGNTFTADTLNISNHKDIDNDQCVGNIQYSYHTSGPQNIRLRPSNTMISLPDKVIQDAMNVAPYVKSSSCPDTLYPSDIISYIRFGINQSDVKIDSLMYLLALLTDNGSTDTLKSKIENGSSVQSYQIFQELMAASPYLSDTVLKASIIKEDVIPNPMLRDVMVANPQSVKTEELLLALDNRMNPMPDSMWAEILQGLDTIGARERLQSELSGWIQKRDIFFNSLISLFLNDTLYSDTGDSLIALLQHDFNLISRYNLISYFLNKHEFSHAENILQSISNEYNLDDENQDICQAFATLIPILEELIDDTIAFNKPDSINSLALYSLASNENLPGVYARNLLIASGLMEYHEPVIFTTSVKSAKSRPHPGKKTGIKSEFKVYPNPCRDFIIIDYSIEQSGNVSTIDVIDSKGVILSSYLLGYASESILIPVKNFLSKYFFIRLNVKGKPPQIIKVIHL